MEHGKFRDKYRSGRNFKWVMSFLLQKKGLSCEEAVEWFVRELQNCDKEISDEVRKLTRPNVETLTVVIHLSDVLRSWIYRYTECIGKKRRLHEKCDCFHMSQTDISRFDLHRLKDIICFLKKYGCLPQDAFNELRAELYRVCRKFRR